MYPESSDGLNKETDDAVYFFTPAFFPLDNFSAHSILLWNNKFPTAEHAFQWKKFSIVAPEIAEQIINSNSPEAVKQISNANKAHNPSTWADERVAVMEEILRAKTAQHDDVKEILLKTNQREVIENSPVDSFWGNGPDDNGQNTLGKTWMKIRDNL